MHVSETELREFIADSGLVSRKDVDAAGDEAKQRGMPLGDLLVSKGFLTDDALRRMQAYVLGIPFVSLKDHKIPPETLALIPEPIARTHNIVSFKKDKDTLEVAMLDVEDLQSLEAMRKKTGLKILPRLTDTESIKFALVQYQKSLKDDFGDIISTEASKLNLANVDPNATGESLKRMAEDLPIVRVVDTLLKHAIVQDASDIHIEPMEDEVLVRYRIDGILHDAMTLPRIAASALVARIKVLSNLKLDEKRLPQDGRFKIQSTGEQVSFRVSVLPTFYGEKIVMRLLRETGGEGFTLESLGFHGINLERIHSALRQTTGIILASGPTGSGKTTTLYTMLDILNTPDVNISTIEDPIEYQMKRVNQTQVAPQIGFTFANGLRSLVRQDPDIIMVGEIRDGETAALAINAALTGHLVLSTIHTNSAAGAIPRLIDMGVEPFLLVSTLKVIIGQRLVRRLTDTKEEYKLTRTERTKVTTDDHFEAALHALKEEQLVKGGADIDALTFYRPPEGGEDEGYKSRIGIHEVLAVSSAIREVILQKGTSESIEAQARKEGMLTMLEDGIYKSVRGLTSLEEVLRTVTE